MTLDYKMQAMCTFTSGPDISMPEANEKEWPRGDAGLYLWGMKRGSRRRTFPSRTPPAPVTERRIVLIDSTPLRKRAETECKRAMAKLEKARAELLRYKTEDQPAFARWLNRTFGELLTKLRENARLIAEKEDLLEDVELEMLCSNHQNPRKAYAAVMKHRENPEEDEARNPEFGARHSAKDPRQRGKRGAPGEFDPEADFDEMGGHMSQKERRAMFDALFEDLTGLRADLFPAEEYERMFAEFEKERFGSSSGGRDPDSPFHGFNFDEYAPDKKAGDRIKEIYRILVRRLHPDVREDRESEVSALWHDVQEAYETRNLERLETLLALTEMQDGVNGGSASIGQMRAAVAELKRALRAVQRSIHGAKHDSAWAFSQKTEHTKLETSIRRDMERDLSQQRFVLAELNRTLAAWSRPWKPAAPKSGKKPKPPVKQANPAQPVKREEKTTPVEEPQNEFWSF